MSNSNISLFVESRYKANRKRIIATINALLQEQEIVRGAVVSVAIVGDRKMRELNKKYRGKDSTTNVLSFPLIEGEQTVLPPTLASVGGKDLLHLGDIIIAYPQVIRESAQENMLVDDRIDMLVKHGLMHLLGIHHEE